MRLLNLFIEDFRHIKGTTIEFGERITVIAGQNGTGKSSVLGWVAQLCKYNGSEKQLNGNKFEEDWSKIFRFCPDSDWDKNYKVKFKYSIQENINDKDISTRLTVITNSKDKRYRADFNRNKGEGKKAIDYPIIYLGLKRLIPIATEDKIEKNIINLTTEESNLFNALSKEILLIFGDDIKVDSIRTTNKKILAMKTDKYSHLGNSAGQDNIGQIVSSILSFKRLKKSLGIGYHGGIILIDEIDATLYAGSQIKLIEVLNKYAADLNLQIIFSTHSLEILEVIDKNIREDTFLGKGVKINFLKLFDKEIKCEINPSIDFIKLKIKAERGKKEKIEKIKKINVVCEDLSAELWIKNLISNTELSKTINPCGANLPKGNLKNLAESKNKELQKCRYVLDGDVRIEFDKKGVPKNICFLPTDKGVEVEMYHFIKSLSDSDNFWNEALNHTKETCFKDHQNGSNQNIAKNWFEDEGLKKDFFGRGYSKLFNRWKSGNKEHLNQFLTNLKNTI